MNETINTLSTQIARLADQMQQLNAYLNTGVSSNNNNDTTPIAKADIARLEPINAEHTEEFVIHRFKALSKKVPTRDLRQVLTRFDVANVRDISPDQYAEVLQVLKDMEMRLCA